MKATVAALLTMLTAACAGVGAPSPSPGIAHPTGPNALVLRVADVGGFKPVQFHLTELPSLSLYGDGRLITQGAQIAIFPGPAMPALQVTPVTPAGMQRILRAAQAAGLLGPDRHYDYQGVADAPTTEFTVVANGRTHRISAYALFEGADLSQVPAEERRPRELLLEFRKDMSDVRGRLGKDVAGPDQPYTPTAIRIVVTKGDPAGADDPNLVNIRDWPLATPLGSFGEDRHGVRCGVLTGTDLETVRVALTASNQLTFWRSGGEMYQLALRPLLPDESGCPAPA
jgi:hypothetical protein